MGVNPGNSLLHPHLLVTSKRQSKYTEGVGVRKTQVYTVQVTARIRMASITLTSEQCSKIPLTTDQTKIIFLKYAMSVKASILQFGNVYRFSHTK